jgi:hypothetical protein
MNMKNVLRGSKILTAGAAALLLTGLVGAPPEPSVRAAKGAQDVVVTNTDANAVPITIAGMTTAVPLFVRDADHPAGNPWSPQFGCQINSGEVECSSETQGFPSDDKMWVIETVSARVVVPVGQKVGDLTLSANGSYQIPLSFQGTIGAFDYYAALTPVRIYMYTGFGSPRVTAFRGVNPGRVLVNGILSGHLVDR